MLDANLAVLWVAGRIDPALPARHKRLRNFGERDFDLLLDHMAQYDVIAFTPNVLTEVSNLIVYGLVDPLRALALHTLKNLIALCEERYVSSAIASARPEFSRLGLTDSGLLATLKVDDSLLTDDDALYCAASFEGHRAINFGHLRAER